MSAQICLIAASTRPNTVRRTYERLTGHAGVARLFAEGRIPKPWIYYCKHPDETVPDYFDRDLWDVTELKKERPFIKAFYMMMARTSPDLDFVFLEEDIAPCLNAMERVVCEPVPPWAGVLSFFDYRNEFPSPGVFPAPAGRDLWGSQAMKFPARHMPRLKEIAINREVFRGEGVDGTDGWAGVASKMLGLTVGHFSPSLFQHLGMLSTFAPGNKPPIAQNYPGEDWDATTGSTEDPIVLGRWEETTESLWCPLHRKNHEPKDFGRCRFKRTA